MISPWGIYLVMQLDSINAMFAILVVLFGLGTVAAMVWMIHSLEYCPVDKESSVKAKGKKYIIGCVSAILFFLMAGTMTPSTKTAAAMYVLPKIVNNENIQKEASELYDLAKQALKNQVENE